MWVTVVWFEQTVGSLSKIDPYYLSWLFGTYCIWSKKKISPPWNLSFSLWAWRDVQCFVTFLGTSFSSILWFLVPYSSRSFYLVRKWDKEKIWMGRFYWSSKDLGHLSSAHIPLGRAQFWSTDSMAWEYIKCTLPETATFYVFPHPPQVP